MNEKRKKMEEKHYKRLRNFLEFDIEEREIEEQKIILLQTINACNDILNKINTKERQNEEMKNENKYKKEWLYNRKG